MECVLFLARKGLPFRGHDEFCDSSNRGNFLDLVEFRARDVPEFKLHLERSINYTSHDIQNELIQLFARQIVQRIAP